MSMEQTQNLPKNKKIIVFSPHPDDDVIGMGGTIIKLVRNNNKFLCAYITDGISAKSDTVKGNLPIEKKKEIRQNEAIQASGIVGADVYFFNFPYFHGLKVKKEFVEKVARMVRAEKPDIIFVPHKGEEHPTHRASTKIVLKALETLGEQSRKNLKEVWFYEITSPITDPNMLISFGRDIMTIKMNAITAHRSQIQRKRYDLAAKGLNNFRGILSVNFGGNRNATISTACDLFAEAFIRKVIGGMSSLLLEEFS